MSNFGKAEYVSGRNRKNPILVYTSKTDRSKVYEFMVASKFKVSGLVSWKCVSCLKIKNDYRNLGEKLDRKVPLILVDNDIIKEDPEKPLNGDHFCSGKDAIDVVVYRAKLKFLAKHEDLDEDKSKVRDTIDDFSKEAVETTPVPLTVKEKKMVKKTLDVRCYSLLQDVRKRKLRKQLLNEYLSAGNSEETAPSTSADVAAENPGNPEVENEREEEEIYEYEEFEVNEGEEEREYCDKNEKAPPAYYYREHSADSSANSTVSEEEPVKKIKLASPELNNSENMILCNSEDIILGNTQDVAYDIELVEEI